MVVAVYRPIVTERRRRAPALKVPVVLTPTVTEKQDALRTDLEHARHVEDVERAHALHDLRRQLGTAPRERLAWLLDTVAYEDLGRLDARTRYQLWQSLLIVIADATA